ncbi:hypothetical protein L1O03_02125 [Corynebacterium uropygiale]|uniref:2TM domain-containing protein n=1 Tax=Corynebacterium uropygiale TaxID=1775911 RepID=A0A9X1TZQ6_9CORY|nr:hypothetical protein [Corynebacterium uropygiale]MCF4005974.1 hypothetical protein [Corynebacterium uropygiale]
MRVGPHPGGKDREPGAFGGAPWRYAQERKTFELQPGRTLVFAVIFAAIVIWQGHMPMLWWPLVLFAVWVIFTLAHWFYVWANNKIQDFVEKARERD